MIREILARVAELQPAWTHINTAEMNERGVLVRHGGPDWLESFRTELAEALGVAKADLLTDGRDGTGAKTEVPWFRFASVARSPKATEGWYCVYLFDTAGESIYLTLACGSTVWKGGDFRTRPPVELVAMANWHTRKLGRSLLGEQTSPRRLSFTHVVATSDQATQPEPQ